MGTKYSRAIVGMGLCWILGLLQELKLAGAHQCLRATGDTELAEDIVDMRLNRADSYHQLPRDLAVRFTQGDQTQHLELA